MPDITQGANAAMSAEPVIALALLALIGAMCIIAKYVLPSRERIEMRRLDIREKEADTDAARVATNKALAEQTRAMRESVDVLARQQTEQTARLNASAEHSHEMGETVGHISAVTDSTAQKVDEMHDIIVRKRQY